MLIVISNPSISQVLFVLSQTNFNFQQHEMYYQFTIHQTTLIHLWRMGVRRGIKSTRLISQSDNTIPTYCKSHEPTPAFSSLARPKSLTAVIRKFLFACVSRCKRVDKFFSFHQFCRLSFIGVTRILPGGALLTIFSSRRLQNTV